MVCAAYAHPMQLVQMEFLLCVIQQDLLEELIATCAAGANIILPGDTGGWGSVSQPMCALCLPGTMSSSVNSMSCTTCPANTFASGPTMQDMGGYEVSTSGGSTECTPCPSGTHSSSGASICY